jgi:ankyrin repeat protein
MPLAGMNKSSSNIEVFHRFTCMLLMHGYKQDKIKHEIVSPSCFSWNNCVQVNARNSYGITPLHMACQAGNLDGVEALLKERNIDVNVQDSNGDTPLHEACLYKQEKVVKLLLKFKPKGTRNKTKLKLVKNHSGHTPFHLACREGCKDIAEQLLKFAEQPSLLVKEEDKEGATALHVACQKDHREIVKFLLGKEADISAPKSDGMTPVHVAAEYGCLNVMRVFLNQPNFNIDIKDRYHLTPLHFAAEYGKAEMIKLLLDQ